MNRVPVDTAPSLRHVAHSQIRELGELAMTMDGVLKLYFGESNLPTPEFIVAAAVEALRDGQTFYSENAGLPALRQSIAEQYSRLHDVDLDPDREIVVTASGLQALHLAIRTVIDPGDEALVLSPAWPNGAAIVALCNGLPLDVPMRLSAGGYSIDFDTLAKACTERTRLVLLTSPSNPLGWVATLEEQQRLLDFCRARGLWLIADEVYERIYYDDEGPAPSMLRLCDRGDAVHVVQSFSKSYCMTGWRVGWLVTRADVGIKAAQLNEFFVSHAATFSQIAARAALEQGDEALGAMVRGYRSNRDYCVEVLRHLPGVTVPEPAGAFYLFPKLEGVDDSLAFCRALLVRERVGLAPGSAFGAGGEGSIRICYAADRSVLDPALERLGGFLRTFRNTS